MAKEVASRSASLEPGGVLRGAGKDEIIAGGRRDRGGRDQCEYLA